MHSQISLDFQMKQERIQGLLLRVGVSQVKKITYPPFPSPLPPPSPLRPCLCPHHLYKLSYFRASFKAMILVTATLFDTQP